MDMKIMLHPENTDSKAGLKQQNNEIKLPLITMKKSAPVSNSFYLKGLSYVLVFTIKVNTYRF